MGMDYQSAGVNVEAGYEAVSLMKEHVRGTFREGVMAGIGGFGGLFSLEKCAVNNPVLVSGTDGVGTKLKLAFALDRRDTVGIDCVAMCVNDIVCSGAEPLFFLDYIAVGKNVPEKVADIVKGVAEGCKLAGCALIGGETAEMPGFYAEDEFDLAGFAVGIVDRERIIDGSGVKPGDAIIGLASSGLHSNGFSLVRKVFEPLGEHLPKYEEEFGRPLGEELLEPTRIYVSSILKLREQVEIKAISHITGGGFVENIPRMLPQGLGAEIREGAWDIPPVFELLRRLGGVDRPHMYNTFNMGVGMALVVSPGQAETALALLRSRGEDAREIGRVTRDGGVDICLK